MNGKLMRITAMTGYLVIVSAMWLGSALATTVPKGLEDSACLECHDGYDKSLSKTVHQLGVQPAGSMIAVHCVSCHEGGDKHIAEPSKDNITNPSTLPGNKAQTLCSQCHTPHPELDTYGFNAHNLQQLNCSSCHSVHSGTPTLMRDAKAQFCLDCHSDTKLKFMRRSAHPVRQGAMTCLSCHKFVRQKDYAQAYDFNRTCQDCHADVGGPFPYEHPAMEASAVNGNGCTECHDPHGSENDRLLRQPGNQTCLSCHAVPGHTTNHDGVYANLACVTCHTDIHGSFTNRSLIDQNVGAKFGKSCYCHGLN
jgi:DmsE family decaheme c-type cytochrome